MKPMLAASVEDINDLRFPLLASVKLDGIRGIIKDGTLLSRSLKPIPNHFVSAYLSRPEFDGLDGELVVGSPNAKDVYRVTNSAIMSRDGEPDFTFYVFDKLSDGQPAIVRQAEMVAQLRTVGYYTAAVRLHQELVCSVVDLEAFENRALTDGYEGVILRAPMGRYKFGRSTVKEGLLLKLKRFKDSEAEIIGTEELMHNENEATTSELGYTKRSSHQENKFGAGVMGALIVRDLKTGIIFNIGTGFTAKDREAAWPVGSVVKYKFFDIGVKEKPRHPVFLGRRDRIDL